MKIFSIFIVFFVILFMITGCDMDIESTPNNRASEEAVTQQPVKKKIAAIATEWCNTVVFFEDGTVKSTDGFVGDGEWSDIIAVSAGTGGLGTDKIIGLRSNGTVISNSYKDEVDDWTDITAISMGRSSNSLIVGLKKDGTVVATSFGEFEIEEEVKKWTDIVQISAGVNSVIALKKDGTVVATGEARTADETQVDAAELVEDWKNIIQVSNGETGGLVALY